MILKSAIKEFLNRPVRDHSRFKSFTHKELDQKAKKLKAKPPAAWSKLRIHQKVCVLLGIYYKKFAFWLDTGCGKTLTSISLIDYYHNRGSCDRALVLVPNKVNCDEWEREVNKHAPSLGCNKLSGTSDDKWEQLTTDKLITVTTYAGLAWMVSDLKLATKSKKKKLVIDPKLIKFIVNQFDVLILDESTSVGSHTSLQFKICKQLCKVIPYIYLLSGTPFGRDPTPLWAQMFLVDQGESLGETLGLFREAFFKKVKNPYRGYHDFKFDPNKQKDLNRLLYNKSIRYEADAADLPKKVHIIKEIPLVGEAQDYYGKIKEALIAAGGKPKEMKNNFIRMRQISSGFVGFLDDETGAKAEVEFLSNPKLESLLSVIQEVCGAHKVVVFHEFRYSGHVICRELKELGIGYAQNIGGMKDPGAQLNKFVNDDNCRVFVTSSAGAFGLNLQVAKYVMFYESPVAPIIRQQEERRVERQGSEHDKVFIYDFVVRGTVDAKILQYLKEGRDLFAAIMKGEKM